MHSLHAFALEHYWVSCLLLKKSSCLLRNVGIIQIGNFFRSEFKVLSIRRIPPLNQVTLVFFLFTLMYILCGIVGVLPGLIHESASDCSNFAVLVFLFQNRLDYSSQTGAHSEILAGGLHNFILERELRLVVETLQHTYWWMINLQHLHNHLLHLVTVLLVPLPSAATTESAQVSVCISSIPTRSRTVSSFCRSKLFLYTVSSFDELSLHFVEIVL